jgi:hypothetical protein
VLDKLDLRIFLAAGALLGGIGYTAKRLTAKKKINIASLIEAALAAAGIPGGIHLILCAFAPDHLVHIVDTDGVIPPGHPVHVELGEWHTVEITVGGVAIAVLMAHVFWAACKR